LINLVTFASPWDSSKGKEEIFTKGYEANASKVERMEPLNENLIIHPEQQQSLSKEKESSFRVMRADNFEL